jgi:hypothetical protein
MGTFQYDGIPPLHAQFLRNAAVVLRKDERMVGMAVAGSLAEARADEFSDVDLVVAVEPRFIEEVLVERGAIARSLGNLAAAFTGEHVGEPRLLVCLYDDPALHVDLKFVPLAEATPVVDNPVMVWDREGRMEAVIRQREGSYPAPDVQWIEDRFWVWVHYLAGKIARGELFEAIEGLSFLRVTVLAPLGLMRLGLSSVGVRRLEAKAPELAKALATTLAGHDRESLWNALESAITIYQGFREGLLPEINLRDKAEVIALRTMRELR